MSKLYKYQVEFQDGFKKTFEAENENKAAAKAVKWAKTPASGRNGKIIVLQTIQL